jgi:hypothetical protein
MSLFSGQGPVFWSNRDATTGLPVEFHWFGNAPAFTLGLAVTTLTHKESYTGQRSIDARIVTELNVTVAITVDDFKESNLQLATYGQGSQVAGANVSGETLCSTIPTIGERYALKATGRVSAVVLSGGGKIPSSQYTVDASGVVVFSDISGITAPVTASYTEAAARQIGIFKNAAPEVCVRIDGLNTATLVSGDFERTIVETFKTRLDPAENFNLINDEFGTLVINGSALVDTLKAAASPTGQFARFIYLDPPTLALASGSASPSVSPSGSGSPSGSASPSV